MSENSAKSMQKRIKTLESVIAETYQLVGSIPTKEDTMVGWYIPDASIVKALDNLSAALYERKLPHKTILPVSLRRAK